MPKNYCDIPPEVTDSIFDYLHDDKKALAHCALTSSKWLTQSRYHLMGKVELTTINGPKFSQLLDSPDSTLPSCVRHLDITEGDYTPERWVARFIAKLEINLVSVKTLIFHGFPWGELDDETKTSLYNGFKSVTFLKLRFPFFEYFAPFAEFVSSFPVLEKLVLDQLLLDVIVKEDVHKSSNYRLPTSVRSVYLGAPEECLVDWLHAQPELQLDSLSVLFGEKSKIPCVASLLCTVGESLLHLEISMPLTGPSLNDASDVCLDLRHHPKLRSIRLHLNSVNKKDGVHWLPSFFSSISSDRIEDITFDFFVSSAHEFGLCWPSLHGIFERPCFSELRVVRFDVIGRFPRPQFESKIREMLSDCEARGILRFGCVWL